MPTFTKRCHIIISVALLLTAKVSGEAPELVVSAPATTPLLAYRGPAVEAQGAALLGLASRAAVQAAPALPAKVVTDITPLRDTTSASAGAAETLRILDADHSGSVESKEIEMFAKTRGMNVSEVQAEFSSLDKNGNGALEAAEIASTLEEPVVSGTAPNPGIAEASTLDQGHPNDLATTVADRARRGAAEIFAREAATMLAQRASERSAVEELEALAKSLRANATVLSRGAPAAAALAAKAAAKVVLDKSATTVKALEMKAQVDAHDAAAERQKAGAAMQRALRAQANMISSVESLSGPPSDHP